LRVPELEKSLGIEAYVTGSQGIGGVIRQRVEDFAVEEVLVDGSKAEISPSGNIVRQGVLGSSGARNRFLLCVLVKRNWDTLSAVKTVADQLGISMGRISIGGMKDARAVTAQYVTVEGVSAEEVRKVKVKDIELRPVGYFHSEHSSYYVLGNSFRIVISAIGHTKDVVKKQIAQATRGFGSIGGVPNFFGHQRFGTTRPITHLVGKAIVKGNLEEAAMLFLAKSSPDEHPSSRLAREQLLSTGDFKQSLECFPKQLRYERLMLAHLAEKPEDYAGAFRRLPLKLQKLFIQAYQSFLFNRFLSQRVKSEIPLNRVQIGDYVVGVERSGLPIVTVHKTVSAGTLVEIGKAMEAGRMRLALPLVGFRREASGGCQGDLEKTILEKEEVKPNDFRVKGLSELSSRGELRAALTPLNDFSVDGISSVTKDREECKAELSFLLYRGSYATIILREIMKPHDLVEAGF
jgi:tRNA pseudouridine13 synthase